jgi:NADH dehydrogenase
MALPGRGHVQVRVQQVSEERVVLATLRGHALAGVVRFSTKDLAHAVRFEVLTCDAAANPIDWLARTLGGARIQQANWTQLVKNVIELSGGTADRVRHGSRTLSYDEAAAVETWIRDTIALRRRGEARDF